MTKKGKSENVQVIVRVRPLNKKEAEAGYKDCVRVDLGSNSVSVDGAGIDGRAFTFDGVYTNAFAQKDVYLQSIHPVVETVLQGYNGTIFAYGQSGTGKTYSMVGNLDQPKQYGIIPHALEHIFQSINELRSEKMEYSVQASFVELYNGKCRDLLVDGKLNLELKENAQKLFYVKDLSMYEIKDTMHAMRLMEDGITRREVKSTELNSDSSRSHSLFTVYVRTWDKEQDLRTEAKLNLVDLAGSERQSKTGATGDALKEGNNINLSLTALGTVIDCLVKQKPHIPYRSSPLTMLLKDGLGGNSRTVIVGTIGPSDYNSSETVSTLRFIDRAKQIKNKPKLQMDPKDAKIAELLEEVKRYKRQLGLLEDEELDDEEESGPVDSPEKEIRRKLSVRMADDEIERLQRRVEELEVELANAQDADAMDRMAQQMAAKEAQLREVLKQREHELQSTISDLNDKLQLQDSDAFDVQSTLDSLITLCADFLVHADREKQWVATVRTSKKSTRTLSDGSVGLEPTVDDIARGFQMIQTNGVDMRVTTLRRTSFVGGHASPPSARNAGHQSGSGASVAPTSGVGQDQVRPPPGTPPAVATPRMLAMQQQLQAPVDDDGRSTTTPSALDGEEFPKRKDRIKKDKRDKKEKKDKKTSVTTSAAVVGALSDAEVLDVLGRYSVPDSARPAVEELLQRQRTSLLAAIGSRTDDAGADAQQIVGDRQQAAELLVAFTQLQEEVEILRAASNKQKMQLEKSKTVAEKKMLEVAQLKEHIDALRDELQSQQAKFDSELQQQQDRLVQQFNRKTESLVAKHTKNLAKERKLRESLDHRIDELTAQFSQMEQEYDTKILECENLLRDYEALKVENLRRFREQQFSQGDGSSAEPATKMKRVVQASIVLDKISGKNHLVKTEELRPEPNSAPDALEARSGPITSPLPSISGTGGQRNVFQRPLPF